jgi:hypothetical protein
MRKIFSLTLIVMVFSTLLSPLSSINAQAYSGIPTFSIVSVVKDSSVTIKAYNFPAGDTFTVTMGPFGTMGIGGIVVGTTNSGSGGTFTVSYSIPAALAGSYQIAIRLQSSSTGYYAYNWFYNNTTGGVVPPPPPSGYTGYPWITISSVIRDGSVTIQAYNFPKNDSFTVTMGPYGSYGIGGIVVGTTTTGSNQSFTATYPIPAALAGSYQIAIRLQSSTSGYFAYNWFYNNTTGGVVPPPPPPDYTGYPWITISSVVRDNSVTIKAYNFPKNDSYTVTMGSYGSYGIGGIVVGTTNTGSDQSFTATYPIPAALAGSYQIAIRLQSSISGYYAYNWFYNNSTP